MPQVPPDVHPSLITDQAGPIHQWSIFEWNIFRDADPANPTAADSTLPPAPNGQRTECVIPELDPSHPISGDDEQEHNFDEFMGDGQGHDDYDEEVEDNNSKRRPLPPSVMDAFNTHLKSLKQMGPNNIPKIYDSQNTFWLPQKSKIFLLHGKKSPQVDLLYNPQFFYWD